MSGGNTKRYTAAELRELSDRGHSRTDLARLDAQTDGDVDRAVAADPDWEGVHQDWHANADAVMPRRKVLVSIRLDADLVGHFRTSGRGWQTRVNAILRAYIEQSKRRAGTAAGS